MSAFSNSRHFVSASARCRGGYVHLAGLGRFLRMRSGYLLSWRGYGDEIDQAPEVLDGRGQKKLVMGAGQSPQSEPREPEVRFQVAEPGFDLFALPSGLTEWRGLHKGSGMVARRFIHVARDPAHR